jgi:hypothetical protein
MGLRALKRKNNIIINEGQYAKINFFWNILKRLGHEMNIFDASTIKSVLL